MTWQLSSAILLGALMLVLVSAGIEDVRRREIANWKNVLLTLLAPLWWLANGLVLWPDMAVQASIALAVFALFATAFHFGMMGGGDVKLLGAVALWLPLQPLLQALLAMSLAGGAITLLLLAEHRLRKMPGQIEIPYGVAIAIAVLLAIREPFFNHFGANA